MSIYNVIIRKVGEAIGDAMHYQDTHRRKMGSLCIRVAWQHLRVLPNIFHAHPELYEQHRDRFCLLNESITDVSNPKHLFLLAERHRPAPVYIGFTPKGAMAIFGPDGEKDWWSVTEFHTWDGCLSATHSEEFIEAVNFAFEIPDTLYKQWAIPKSVGDPEFLAVYMLKHILGKLPIYTPGEHHVS